MTNTPTISVAMIVKNEQECLPAALCSVQGADEVVVVDTGSTDATVELARAFGARVFCGPEFAWRDDFAWARNKALEQCTGDWVLSLDADEVLEPGGMEKVRAAAAATQFAHTVFVRMRATGTGDEHKLARLFRRTAGVGWVGAGHETIAPHEPAQYERGSDIVIIYGSSPAHALDPDRMLRILSKAAEANPAEPRTLYYLAREYYYRQEWSKAAELYEKYLTIATFMPEIADALLLLARCYWQLQQGNKAREVCTRAVVYNPSFKEALLFMAELHHEPWSHRWRQLAAAATNEDVLFIR